MNLRHSVVAITGAAQGIGRHLALEFAKEGAEVAISDMTLERLDDTATLVRAIGVEPLLFACDVSRVEQMHAFAGAVWDRFGHADVMINNAGVAMLGSIDEIDVDEFEWLMNINFWGSVYAAKAFLPLLRASGKPARLGLMSSVFGLFGPSGNGPYVASKFAVRGFGESLYNELRGTPVGVTLVHPGGIATTIARSARVPRNLVATVPSEQHELFETLAKTSPQQAARTIVNGIKAGKRRVLIGGDARVIDLVTRLFPMRTYEILSDRLAPKPATLVPVQPKASVNGVLTNAATSVGV